MVALCACGGSSIKSGTIIAKQYHPASSHIFMSPIYGTREQCSFDGKNTNCYPITYVITYVPITIQDDEFWTLRIKSCGDSDKCREGSVRVPRGEYDSAAIGAHWEKGA